MHTHVQQPDASYDAGVVASADKEHVAILPVKAFKFDMHIDLFMPRYVWQSCLETRDTIVGRLLFMYVYEYAHSEL